MNSCFCDPDKPSQPGEIDVVTVTNNMVKIHWQAPECDGGKMVLGYWVECRKSTESTWKKCNKQRLKEEEFSVAGLAEATEYEFRVFAENETGMSRPRRTAACIKTKLSGTHAGTSNNIYIYMCIYVGVLAGVAVRTGTDVIP